MVDFSDKKNILWDFDGVLIDSHEIREEGFVRVLKDFPRDEVDELLAYHRENGGLSRYVKFRYFFEKIRNEPVSEKKIDELSEGFSEIMRRKLTDRSLLIEDSLHFIQKNFRSYKMHLISGSDENELQTLCAQLGISEYFRTIQGSPTPKKELVREVMDRFDYQPAETVYIGDSINDYDAAIESNVDFYGYNNPDLKEKGAGYIESFP